MRHVEFSIEVFFITGGSQWVRGFEDWGKSADGKKTIADKWIATHYPGARYEIRAAS